VNAAGVAWAAVLGTAEQAFTAPSWVLFANLVQAWVCCPTRRTITGMLTLIDPAERACHDAYHRLVRAGAWSMTACWSALATLAVARFAATGAVVLQVDDTLFHKSGRRVDGAGSFRDAVASTGARIVYAHGLNLVVVTLRVHPPWGGEPLGLPVNVRLFRKGGPTHAQLVQEMIAELSGWLPERSFILCGDGAYATLAGSGLPRTHVISRMRRDAALFEPAPPRTGRRGRPAKKGARLPTPAAQATAAPDKDWTRASINRRGRTTDVDLLTRAVLWYAVKPDQQVLLVIVRDPDRDRTRRLLLHHRPGRRPRRRRHRIPLPLGHRGHLPGGQATPRRPTAANLERRRPRTRRRTLVLDLHRDLVLVHPHPRPRPTLADPALVPQQAHPELPRRPRRTTNNPVAPTNYRHLRPTATHPTNRGHPHRHARKSRLTHRESAKVHLVPMRKFIADVPAPGSDHRKS